MDVIMNGLLIAGTLFAGLYCHVLAGRVRALKSLDSGLGGAIVTLTRQIELARATLDEARAGSRETRLDLTQLIARADAATAQLRLLLVTIEKAETRLPAAVAPIPAASPPPALAEAAAGPVAKPSEPPPVDAPALGLAVRRRETPGPRLVPPPEPDDEPEEPAAFFATAPGETGIPKPRRPLSLDGLLRRRGAPDTPAAPQTEEALMAALTALAAGGER